MKTLEVLFAPAELAALPQRNLRQTICVVFDVLRATSSIVTALANGAAAVIPVSDIAEALEWRRRQPAVLLAGERDGVRIRAHLTGGIDFDLGNSPREFTAAAAGGKTIVTTTTNGTRALRACASAQRVFPCSFLNLRATVSLIERCSPENLLLVCSGTREHAALEDALAAGAMGDLMLQRDNEIQAADSALMACELYRRAQSDLPSAVARSTNGRRLLANPDLRDDVAWCLQRDVLELAVEMDTSGFVSRTTKSTSKPATL